MFNKASQNNTVDIVVLTSLTIVSFYLRYRNLGELGFAGDEELTSLAVKGLLEQGYPSMPTGMLYLRGLPFSYLAALSIKLFGDGEFATRFPSILFGTFKVPLIYLFCKRLFNRETAILTALLLTFAVWDIQFSRAGRMYSMFGFFYLLSLYSYYNGFIREEKMFLWLTPPLFVLTTMVHQLGVFLVPLFLLSFVIINYKLWLKKLSLSLFIGIGVIDYVILKMIKRPYSLKLQAGQAVENSLNDSGFLSQLFSHIYYPKLELFSYLIQFYPNAIGITLLLCIVGVAVFIYKKYPCFENTQNSITSISLLVTAGLHLYGLSVIILILHIFTAADKSNHLLSKQLLIWMTFLFLSFLSWFAYGYVVWKGYGFEITGHIDLVRKIIKSLVYFPPIDIRIFIYAFPKMTIVVVTAIVFLMYKCVVDRNDVHSLLVMFIFLIPLMLSGLMKEWTQSRYSYNLYPIFLMIYSWFISELTSGVVSLVRKTFVYINKGGRFFNYLENSNLTPSLLILIFLLFISLEYIGISDAYFVSHYSYGDNTHKELDGFISYPDHKGAGLYVKQRLQEQDLVIAEDLYQQTYYVGRVDYRIKSLKAKHNSTDYRGKNIYTGAKTIHDLYELLNILNNNQGRVWIILSGEMKPETRVTYLDKSIENYLLNSTSDIAYKGRDGKSNVYLFYARKDDLKSQ